jgi:hypothetical protein
MTVRFNSFFFVFNLIYISISFENKLGIEAVYSKSLSLSLSLSLSYVFKFNNDGFYSLSIICWHIYIYIYIFQNVDTIAAT